MDLCNINDIKALLSRHGFRFSKFMGQNFLIEDWLPVTSPTPPAPPPAWAWWRLAPASGPLTRSCPCGGQGCLH